MADTSILSRVFSVDVPGNPIKRAWDLLSPLPGGRSIFSKMIGQMAPYTGSIDPYVEKLERGRARVRIEDHRSVRNHLRSVHAVAMVNLAELAGNLALFYSLPEDGRFIVAGITIEYVKKARGTITAEGECPIPETSERREYEVKVTMRDAGGDVVARSTLRSLVGPKKG